MRTSLLLGWLLVPVAFGAYHYGPGQGQLRLDDVARVLAEADRGAAAADWTRAASKYEEALAMLPPDKPAVIRRVRLERDKAWLNDRKLPEANADLAALVDELQADPKADRQVLAGARGALAGSQYYMTWLKKLEGLGREEWEPDIEGARQTYRLLAEQAEAAGDATAAAASREDLEGAIRLARMDPAELQGKSLPSQCEGCKSGQCQKPGKKPGKKPGQKPGEPKDSRNAGSGPPPDGSGS